MAENRMKSIIPVIVTSFNFDDEKWDKEIYLVERKLNSAFNKTTACSPFQCLYGYIPTFEDATMVNHVDREENTQTIEEIREKVRKTNAEAQQKYKAYYNRTHFDGVEYNVGDIVAIKRNPTYTGEPTKTQLKYRGPLVVIEKLPSDCYRLEKLTKQDGGKHFVTTSHVSQMKIYKNHEDDSDDKDLEEEEVYESNGEFIESPESEVETEAESDEEDQEWKPKDEIGEVSTSTTGRPRQNAGKPSRFQDFV